jgi:hypothetical protein
MSAYSLNTLDSFIQATELKLWTRPYADWYGSIVLSGLDTLKFELLIFRTKNLERTNGTTCRFEWDSKEEDLVLKAQEMTEQPILEKDHLRVPFSGQQFWYDKKQYSEVPGPLIEAFLDDVYRSKILTALADRGQRIECLRWLTENEFPVYRHLRTPADSQGTYEEIVFSPKLDFLTNS